MKVSEQLRKSILQAAIQGKLTEQLESDGSAYDLLEEIRAKKEQLIKDKKIKKEKPLAPITDEEIPFDIPENWEWVTLQEIYHPLVMNDGDWILSNDMVDKGEVKLIQLGNIGNGKYLEKGYKYLTKNKFDDLKCKEIYPGYLLFNRIVGGGVYACIIPENIDGKLITSVDALWIAPTKKTNIRYIMYLLLSGYIQSVIDEKKAGSTRLRISKGNLINIPIPLPPLSEQQRIVEKIEELLPELELLKEQEDAGLKADIELPERLRKSLIQAAMQGKLTEQLESDGTAFDLLEEIRAEKAQLIKDKKIKKEKLLPPISEEDIPFDIPENWEWVRLGEVSYNLSSRQHQIKSSEVNKEGLHPVISQSATFIDGFSNQTDKLLKADYPILIFGDHSKTIKYIDFDFIVGADGTKLIRPLITPMFLYYVINYLLIGMETKNYGRHFNLLSNQLFPVPPLSEQQRIVEKLDLLLDEVMNI